MRPQEGSFFDNFACLMARPREQRYGGMLATCLKIRSSMPLKMNCQLPAIQGERRKMAALSGQYGERVMALTLAGSNKGFRSVSDTVFSTFSQYKVDSVHDDFVGEILGVTIHIFREGGDLQRLSGRRLEVNLPFGKATPR